MALFYPSMTTGERILQLLPATSTALLEQLDITSTSTLHKWVSRLRKDGKMHIGRWERTLGPFAPVYVLGSGKDAPRPKRWTSAQLQKRYRKALKDAGLYEDYLADARLRGSRYRRRKGQGRPLWAPDPLMAAFYRNSRPGNTS